MKIRSESLRRARAGFTLAEVSITAVVLIVLGATIAQSSGAMRIIMNGGTAQDLVMTDGMRAMDRIRDDLKSSGFVGDYPRMFNAGDAGAGYENHDHAVASKHATGDDPDAGDDREVIFVRPADDDGDGVPDVNGAGAVVWDAREFSYVRVDDAGVPVLQRRVDGANGVTIARNVERVLFEKLEPGYVVPEETVRVTLYFRKFDAGGHLCKYTAQSLVKLRNQ